MVVKISESKIFQSQLRPGCRPSIVTFLLAPCLLKIEPIMICITIIWVSWICGIIILWVKPPWHHILSLQDFASALLSYWSIIVSLWGSTWHDIRILSTYTPQGIHPYDALPLKSTFAFEPLIPFLLKKVKLADSSSLMWPSPASPAQGRHSCAPKQSN